MKVVNMICERLMAAQVGFRRVVSWSPTWGLSDRVEAMVGEGVLVAEENSATGYATIRIIIPREGERPERAIVFDFRQPEKGWQGAVGESLLIKVRDQLQL